MQYKISKFIVQGGHKMKQSPEKPIQAEFKQSEGQPCLHCLIFPMCEGELRYTPRGPNCNNSLENHFYYGRGQMEGSVQCNAQIWHHKGLEKNDGWIYYTELLEEMLWRGLLLTDTAILFDMPAGLHQTNIKCWTTKCSFRALGRICITTIY